MDERCNGLNPDPDVSGIGVIGAIIAQSCTCVILCLFYCALHSFFRSKYGTNRGVFNFNAATFKTIIDLANVMTVLALGLTVGLIIKQGKGNSSAYHSRMIIYLVNLSSFSIVLTHYFLWSTNRFPQRKGGEDQEQTQIPNPAVHERQKSILQLKWQRAVYLLILAGIWITSLVLDLGNKSSLTEEYTCVAWKKNQRPDGPGAPNADAQAGLFKYLALIEMVLLTVSTAFGTWLRRKIRNSPRLQPGDCCAMLFCGSLKVLWYIWIFYIVIITVGGMYANVQAILQLRRDFSVLFDGAEDDWGVGQVLAVVLFLVPVVEFFFSIRPFGDVERNQQQNRPAGFPEDSWSGSTDGGGSAADNRNWHQMIGVRGHSMV